MVYQKGCPDRQPSARSPKAGNTVLKCEAEEGERTGKIKSAPSHPSHTRYGMRRWRAALRGIS